MVERETSGAPQSDESDRKSAWCGARRPLPPRHDSIDHDCPIHPSGMLCNPLIALIRKKSDQPNPSPPSE